MIILPAMDFWGGDIVKLEAKRHRSVELVYGKPAAVAERWLGLGASWLHCVDLTAALENGDSNLRFLKDVVAPKARAAGAKVQWGGGVRDDASLQAVIEAGADRVIVGTKAVRDWTWLEEAARKNPGKIMVSIDGKGREILVAGWQESAGVDCVEFLRRTEGLPLGGYLYTNVAVEGRGQGVDWAPVQDVVAAAKHPVVFSGGVTSLDDVARFKALGVYGIIAGSALYKGWIDFTQAQQIAR